MTFLRLDPREITSTVRSVRDRIVTRFPESDLGRVADALVSVAESAVSRSAEIGRPNRSLRALVAAVVVAGIAIAIAFVRELPIRNENPTWSDFLQGVESGLAGIVLLGAAVVFLVSLEHRMKRRRAIRALFELRSLAHIVDLHQLAKDPARWQSGPSELASPPEPRLDPYEMGRYLDFCGDLLSLIAKIGALYVEHLEDPVVLEAADSIEELTSGLSRKIWQKIGMLDRILGGPQSGSSES
jgi:hypothetical protein